MKYQNRMTLLFLFLLVVDFRPSTANSLSKAAPNSLHINLYDGYLIVVEGQIGHLRGLRFAVDTGSTRTMIDVNIAHALALPIRPASAFNLDKTLHVSFVTLPEISFGPQTGLNLNVLVADLAHVRPGGSKVDAILGLDLLAQTSLRIDFVHKQIYFGEDPPTLSTNPHLRGYSVPLQSEANSIQVNLEVGDRSVAMILDTGMPGILFYEDKLDAFAASYSLEATTAGHSIAGAIDSQIAVVPRLRLGSIDLDRRVRLLHSDTSIQNHAAGYIGLSALSPKEVNFDFANHQFSWKK
jgi:Aspartyl protease